MIYNIIVFLPLLGFFISAIGGNYIGARICEYVTSSFMIVVALFSWSVFFEIGLNDGRLTQLFGAQFLLSAFILDWISSGMLTFHWGLHIDTLTAVMLVVVNSISMIVHIYSIGYMKHDPHRPRFFAYLSFFTFMMLMLITSDNLIQMFFGWEGVGLASYLLIGFWYQRPSANKAAMKAFLVNRVSDFCFLLGILSVFILFDAVDFSTIFSKATDEHFISTLILPGWNLTGENSMNLVCIFLFIGAMGKSAQFLLHTWLPDAMEGPTPVSALIHAATMVTAGVFMIARMSPLFELAPAALSLITIIGAITALFASTVALVQNDIKRVIAYSTCSQLGYMFVALGIGAYGAAIFHLFTHAFFKALLFLGAGSVIHAVSNEQDIRYMGGLRKYIPATYWMMITGTLALTGVGIPGTVFGTSGFFSKDIIIEAAFTLSNFSACFAFWLLVIAMFFTSFYSWRLIFMIFHGRSRITQKVMSHIRESPTIMLVPLFFLAVGALFSGVLFQPFFFGEHSNFFWKTALFTSEYNFILEKIHDVPSWVHYLPLFTIICGLSLSYLFYILRPSIPEYLANRYPFIYDFLLNKWYFDEFYDTIFVRPVLRLGIVLWKLGDCKLIDGLGTNGVAVIVMNVTQRIVRIQTGYLYHYAFAMLIGVAVLITWIMIGSVNL